MAHMPSFMSSGTWSSTQTAAPARIVTYVATGLEGVDFFVPIGVELPSDDYDVGFFGAAGAAAIPAVWDFPNAVAGDRTTTQFRVTIPAPLSLGDVFKFALTAPTITVSSTFEPDDTCGCGGGGTFFPYVATGTEGDTFTVTLPDEISGDYAVIATCGEVANHLTFNTDTHTSTTFRLICSAAPAAGDVIFFTVGEVEA